MEFELSGPNDTTITLNSPAPVSFILSQPTGPQLQLTMPDTDTSGFTLTSSSDASFTLSTAPTLSLSLGASDDLVFEISGGLAGPKGAAGADGTDGTDGTDGKTVLNGTGAPSSGTGVDGDFYIDTSSNDIYGPKASSAWGSGTSLVGPQGPQGAAGSGSGDMLASTYDPNSVDGDAFDMDNMAQGTTNKYITAAELTVLGNTSGTNTGDQTSVSGNAGTATKLATGRNIDGQSFDGSADITVIAPGTHAATSKTTPVDVDELPMVDSADSNVLKKLTWSNLKATLKTYFDTLYQATGSYITASSTDTLTNKDLTDGTNTFPTFNQNTTGSAATLTTGRTIRTNLASTSAPSFNGSANITPGVSGTLSVSHGGTGNTTATTAYGLIAAGTSATGAFQTISPGSSGDVLTSNGASALPTFQTPVSSGGLTWSVVSGTSQAAISNNGYIVSNSSLTTITLPSAPAVGDVVRVVDPGDMGDGSHTGGWKVAQPTYTQINFGTSETSFSTSGSLASSAYGDAVELLCTISSTSIAWSVISSIGNITIV